MLEVEREGWRTGTCNRCGAKVVWATRTDKEGKIPLDPKAPIFAAHQDGLGEAYAMQTKEDTETKDRLFVSHFSTCPAMTRVWQDRESYLKRLKALGGE